MVRPAILQTIHWANVFFAGLWHDRSNLSNAGRSDTLEVQEPQPRGCPLGRALLVVQGLDPY